MSEVLSPTVALTPTQAPQAPMSTTRPRTLRALVPSRWLPHALVLAGAAIMLAPFYFMFVFATHTNTEILSVPPPLWFGSALLDNINDLVAQRPHFWRSVGLSSAISTVGMEGPLGQRPSRRRTVSMSSAWSNSLLSR